MSKYIMHTSCIVYLIASYSYMQHYCYCCYPFLPVIGTGEHTQKAQLAGGIYPQNNMHGTYRNQDQPS